MTLTQQEITQFYRIWCALIWGVNEKHGIVPKFDKPVYGNPIKQEPFIAVRAVLWDNPEWIDDFIRNNDFSELNETDLEILADWRKNFVKGSFVLMRHLKKYSVFMTFEEDAKLYGVCGITDSFGEMVPCSALPLMIDTTLLPFNGKIIYDSFIGYHNFSFGGGYKESLKQSYNEAKTKTGILENMSQPPKARMPALPPIDTKEINIPNALYNQGRICKREKFLTFSKKDFRIPYLKFLYYEGIKSAS